ncbi:putative nuclease HARBI1 [Myzus persicae]|uniref:putative nuclease HARBI1 n=1 Tax=Myzus persicae TaxID=13164 RepID=UPI000B9386E6|nr:putative nuclease HARBI1 [Myzus persicae]
MGVSTIAKIIQETCEAIWTHLQPIEMAAPTEEDWLGISEGFYTNSQFPNCVGAVDGKHIRLQCPPNSGTLYHNYKHFFSLILMAICDANYCFRVIDVGSYGKESDCNIFKKSIFGKKLYNNKVNFPQPRCLPGDEQGIPQPFIVVGDEAFALHTNLLRPFPGKSLNDKRRIFNYRLSRARQNIECSFGILSNKWRVFHTTLLVEPNFAFAITKAACVLHNFVRRRDGYNSEDAQICNMENITRRNGVGNSTSNAKDVREYFVNYFNNPAHELSWQKRVI